MDRVQHRSMKIQADIFVALQDSRAHFSTLPIIALTVRTYVAGEYLSDRNSPNSMRSASNRHGFGSLAIALAQLIRCELRQSMRIG